MRFLITGGTGFLGRHLAATLTAGGHQLVVLARDPRRAGVLLPGARIFEWNGLVGLPPAEAFEGVDVIVNLIGERADRRWTQDRKRLIRESRVLPTRSLVERMADLPRRPRALISMAGVGYYGSRGDEVLTEKSAAGKGFLAGLGQEWEASALRAEALGDVRVVLLRAGVVLGRGGGILGRIVRPFRMGLGARLGNGRQYFPWIHLTDMLGILLLAATRDDVAGPINAVAPEPITNAELTAALGAAVQRPAALAIPRFALRLAFGAMADEMLLSSLRVSPIRALEVGYDFRFPLLRQALADVVRAPRPAAPTPVAVSGPPVDAQPGSTP